MDKDEKEIDLKQGLFDDMDFAPSEEKLLDEPQVVTGLDGYTLEDDPEGNNMVSDKNLFDEESQEKEIEIDSLV